MPHWLHSLLPHAPHHGFELVFIVVFINNIGVPLPGETVLIGAGFFLGHAAGALWQPMLAGTTGAFLGGICAYSLGLRLGRSGLERVRWLHLTPKRLRWPERFLERHGAKTVFFARFIAVFPPIAANLLAGMAKMPWRTFLLFNAAGSAASAVSYILLGYFFGREWRPLETWMGPTALYLSLAVLLLIPVGVIFRDYLSKPL